MTSPKTHPLYHIYYRSLILFLDEIRDEEISREEYEWPIKDLIAHEKIDEPSFLVQIMYWEIHHGFSLQREGILEKTVKEIVDLGIDSGLIQSMEALEAHRSEIHKGLETYFHNLYPELKDPDWKEKHRIAQEKKDKDDRGNYLAAEN